MSSHCTLKIDTYDVLTSSASVVPEIMVIFRESDKKIYKSTDEEGSDIYNYEYSNTVKNIKERLNILGFSLANIEKDFNVSKLKKIKELEDEDDFFDADYKKENKIKTKVLKESSYLDWIEAYKEIRAAKKEVRLSWYKKTRDLGDKMTLVDYILDEEESTTFYNLPNGDFLAVIRLFLETCKNDKKVTLDITELVDAGWYEPNDEVCTISMNILKHDYPVNEKIIILTEGSTDKEILEQSLKTLYPHLAEYYSFLEFSHLNMPGSASVLVTTVKAFASSGINNRIIAIFDNDTAAKSAVRILNQEKLPKNIKILHYPNIQLADKYPTLGPGGVSKLNINGLACSIEVYLGKDIIKKNGKYTPIQWKGYDTSINQYQGEILEKTRIQKEFLIKIKEAQANLLLVQNSNWNELRKIFELIFATFQ
jgi:hypothetical protein